MRRENRKAAGMMVIASFLWGTSFVASKVCLNAGLQPFETVFFRMAAGSVCIGLVFQKDLRKVTRQGIGIGVLLGLLTSATYAFEMYGISMTEAAKSSFLTSTNVVMMPFLCALFFRTKPSPRSVLAGVLALTGVWFLSLAGSQVGGLALGDLLLLITALLEALNSISVAKAGAFATPVQITFFQLLVTAVFSGIMMLFQGRCESCSIQAVSALAYLAVGPTLIAFLLKNYAIQRLSPIKCTLILSTQGVFCVLASMAVLRERLTLPMTFGILLIFVSILVEETGAVLWRHIRRETSAP